MTKIAAKQWMSLLHGWIGGISSVFVLCVAITGIGLAFFGELAELQYGDMLKASKQGDYADPGALISAAAAGYEGFDPMGIFMPDTRMENLETALVFGGVKDSAGNTSIYLASIDPVTAQYKGSFDLHDMFAHELNDFHFNLLAGETGASIIAIVSILLCLFALSGIYLWWPRKGSLIRKLTTLQVKGRWHALWMNWHGFAGIWLGIFIVYYAMTGLALSKSDWFGPLLSQVEDPIEYETLFREKDCGEQVTSSDAADIAMARFPNSELTGLMIVDEEQFKYVIRLRREGDMDARFGDTQMQIHAKCRDIVWVNHLKENDLPTVIGGQMLSLHGAHFLPWHWPAIITTLIGLALTLLSVSGLYLFFKRTIPSTNAILRRAFNKKRNEVTAK